MAKCKATKQCNTPGVWFRKPGMLWACECGNVFRLGYIHNWGESIKLWQYVGNMMEDNEVGN